MRIGIEVQRLFRKKKHGMEIVALETLRELQKSDLENEYEIIVKKDDHKSGLSETGNFKINQTNGKPYPVWEQLFLPQLVRKLKLDLLHCTSNTAPLFCKTPLVITIHDVIYMEKIEFSGSSYQNFGNLYRRFIVPRVAKKSVAIITVSEYSKKLIAETLQINPEKIKVIYNGVSHAFHLLDHQQVQSYKEKKKLPGKFFLHFSNTAARKNTNGTIKAYVEYCRKVLMPMPFVITSTDKQTINDLLKSLNAPELSENIHCLGYVSDEDLPFLYNAATIFLYPSFNEGFGLPVIESMACGTPVITSNVTSLPEVAGDAALQVDPSDTNAIAAAMKTLGENEELYNDLIKKGFENARKFSWKKAAEKIISVYKEALNINK